jgi:polysaccharide pyruvyl transferase WcaK-like protein
LLPLALLLLRLPPARSERKKLALNFARFADHMIEKYEKPVALLCMEELDEPLAQLIRSSMKHSEKTMIFSSREYNASQMTSILRSLELLVTSRYHAGVLSLDAAVPQTAIGHDQRLRDLYRDLEIYDDSFWNIQTLSSFSFWKKGPTN